MAWTTGHSLVIADSSWLARDPLPWGVQDRLPLYATVPDAIPAEFLSDRLYWNADSSHFAFPLLL